MKTIFKLAMGIMAIMMMSCDNDNGNTPNQTVCTYEGLTYYDNNQNTQTLIPEANLTTEYFQNTNGTNIPEVEIYKTDDISMVFTTDVVTLNATGTGSLIINNDQAVNVTVTCQRSGSQVGDELRYDITHTGFEAEFCVTIDDVTP